MKDYLNNKKQIRKSNKMKKLYMIIGVLLFIGVVSASTITISQFTSISDNQIKNYLINNLQSENLVIDKNNEIIYFYYSTIGLNKRINETINETNGEPYFERNEGIYFEIQRKEYIQTLKIKDIEYCLNNYNSNICWNNLVFNKELVLLGNVSIQPVWYQLEKQLIREYNDIRRMRDSYNTINIDNFLDEYNSNIPEVTI